MQQQKIYFKIQTAILQKNANCIIVIPTANLAFDIANNEIFNNNSGYHFSKVAMIDGAQGFS